MKVWPVFILIIGLFLISCQESKQSERLIRFAGQTMGTTYSVAYFSQSEQVLKKQVDSLLVQINLGVSTYIPESVISVFNKSEHSLVTPGSPGENITQAALNHFDRNFRLAEQFYQETKGAYDPTVMPLVNYWGFGYTPRKKVDRLDSLVVDSIQQLIGFDRMRREVGDSIRYFKRMPGMQLDFSASAKGYGVDLVGEFLEKQGLLNYLVEIGGEVRAKGKKSNGKFWRIGINVPSEDAAISDFEQLVMLENRSMATSGNYRNFYEIDGAKYSHTINPKTGFPERSNLLSATLIARECARADAMATACMVLGLEKGLALVEADSSLEAFFIWSDEKGNMKHQKSSGIDRWLINMSATK